MTTDKTNRQPRTLIRLGQKSTGKHVAHCAGLLSASRVLIIQSGEQRGDEDITIVLKQAEVDGRECSVNPLNRTRLKRGAEYLRSLDASATAELVAEVARPVGGLVLAEYERHLTPAMIRDTAANRVASRPVCMVPRC